MRLGLLFLELPLPATWPDMVLEATRRGGLQRTGCTHQVRIQPSFLALTERLRGHSFVLISKLMLLNAAPFSF